MLDFSSAMDAGLAANAIAELAGISIVVV